METCELSGRTVRSKKIITSPKDIKWVQEISFISERSTKLFSKGEKSFWKLSFTGKAQLQREKTVVSFQTYSEGLMNLCEVMTFPYKGESDANSTKLTL